MPYLTSGDFFKKFAIRRKAQLLSPLFVDTDSIILPKKACVHYLPEMDTELGIHHSHCLMRNVSTVVNNYHVTELVESIGKVKTKRYNYKKDLTSFRKRNATFNVVKKLDRAKSNQKLPLVMDYSFLPRMYHYNEHQLKFYHEYKNLFMTVLKGMEEVGDEHEHFMRIKLPQYIPTRKKLEEYSNLKFGVTALEYFRDFSSMDLLQIWKMLLHEESIQSELADLPKPLIAKISFVFVESNRAIIVRMSDLLAWAVEDPKDTARSFYRMIENLMSTRVIKEIDEANDHTLSDEPEDLMESISRSVEQAGEVGDLSAAQQASLKRMSERYKSIPSPMDPTKTLEDCLKVEPDELTVSHEQMLPDSVAIHDKSMLYSSINDFDTKYIEKSLHNDIIRMIMHLQKGDIIIRDIKTKEKKDIVSDSIEYSIQVLPVGGTQSTLKSTVPNVGSDGEFISSGSKCRLVKQRGDVPIFKEKPYVVKLTSYYDKCMITRTQNAASNYARWIEKRILKHSEEGNVIEDISFGFANYKGLTLPRRYTAIGEKIVRIKAKNAELDFRYNKLVEETKPERLHLLTEQKLHICGHRGKRLVGMNNNGVLFDETGDSLGTLSEFLELGSEGPIEYSEITLYGKSMPLIVVLCYVLGIEDALSYLGLTYEDVPLGTRHSHGDDRNYMSVKFKDTTLVFNISKPEHALLVGGFNAVRKVLTGYRFTDLNKQSVYLTILNNSGASPSHLREFKQMFKLFVEPITEGLLKEMGEPVTFKGLVVKANNMLVDDSLPLIQRARFKGYERIPGIFFNELIKALRVYTRQKNMPDAKFTMQPNAVFMDVITDETLELVDEINPVKPMREKSTVTLAGYGGRSGRVVTRKDVGFTKADIGVISEATPDSPKAGARTYTTHDPKFTSTRGLTEEMKDTDGPASLVSSTMLMFPASNRDSPKRQNFANIQLDAAVPGKGYTSSPYRTGGEQIVANQTSKTFARTARLAGVVTNVTDTKLEVKYSDGSTEKISLKTNYGNSKGHAIALHMTTDLFKGRKFGVKEVLTWNPDWFERDPFLHNVVCFKNGALGKIAFCETSSTIDDSSEVTHTFAQELVTPSVHAKNIIMERDQVITDLVKIGDHVEADSILCTITDKVSSELSDSSGALGDLSRIAANNPPAEHSGTVVSIECIYFSELDECHESVAKVLKASDLKRAKDAKDLGEKPVTGKITAPMQVGGNKIIEGKVVVKILIAHDLPFGNGDKVVFYNQLKSTNSRIVYDAILTESGESLVGFFGYQSVSDRIVGSSEMIGATITVMKQLTSNFLKDLKGG